MDDYLRPEVLARVDELVPVARELDLSMAQLALAWCLRQPGVSSTIVGVTKESQLHDNVGASGVALPDEVVAKLDALFPQRGL